MEADATDQVLEALACPDDASFDVDIVYYPRPEACRIYLAESTEANTVGTWYCTRKANHIGQHHSHDTNNNCMIKWSTP